MVDDHAMFADAVAQAIAHESDLALVCTTTNLRDAEAVLDTLPVDAVIVDCELHDESGVDLLRCWSVKRPDIKFIMLTNDVRRDLVLDVLSAGAAGVISKSRPASDLIDALRSARNGRVSVLLEAEAQVDRPETIDVALTERETSIMRLLAEGRTDGEVGEVLCISRNTVRTHVRRAFAKLGASSRLEAVAIARRHQLI